MLKWYREHLAKDFLVIESDGSTLNKAEFLTNSANNCEMTEGGEEQPGVSVFYKDASGEVSTAECGVR